MVGYDVTGGEQLQKLYLFHAQFLCLFVGEEGIKHQYLHAVSLQHLDDELTDHAGADDAHLDVKVTGIVQEELTALVASSVFRDRRGEIVPLVGKNDLRNGVLRYGNGVCRPGGKHLNATVQKRSCKKLYRACRIKDCLKRGEIAPYLLLVQLLQIPR